MRPLQLIAGTVLAALRFWQRLGPSRPHSVFDRLECDEQDALDDIRTGAGRFDPLTTEEIDSLCERLNTRDVVASEPCACELPGVFCSEVPGILARIEQGRLAPGATVERCDLCQRYPDDEAAYRKLRELGMA